MQTFTKEQIREISEQLDCGFRAFYHNKSGELIFIPDIDKHFDIEMDAWKSELQKLKKERTCYVEIEGMESADYFRMMEDFADQISDTEFGAKLRQALNRKGPFREFKFVIDNSLEHRQAWFDFKDRRQIEWTELQLKIQGELNSLDNASN